LGEFPKGALLVERVSTREEMVRGLSKFFRNHTDTVRSSHYG
jgi:hypothetical protein